MSSTHIWRGLSIIASVSELKPESRPRGLIRARTALLRLLHLQKNNVEILPEIFGTDLRDIGPVHICTCGCTVFKVLASFEDYEIVWWFLDGECANCGNLVRIPCPIDKDEAQPL